MKHARGWFGLPLKFGTLSSKVEHDGDADATLLASQAMVVQSCREEGLPWPLETKSKIIRTLLEDTIKADPTCQFAQNQDFLYLRTGQVF